MFLGFFVSKFNKSTLKIGMENFPFAASHSLSAGGAVSLLVAYRLLRGLTLPRPSRRS
jgi:hypothetical protein